MPALRRSSAASVLSILALACAAPAARAQSSPAPDEDFLGVDVSLRLRAYAVMPKFRFRDGQAGAPGSSIRTQKIGLDAWRAAPGAAATVWLQGSEALTLEGWTLTGGGTALAPKDFVFRGITLRAGEPMHTDYALGYVALEYLHRFQPLDWFWIDAGARLEYLDFRVGVGGAGRTSLEGAWPTVRVGVGLRPFSWLELEGHFGGFELTVPLTSTNVTQPYEVGGLVRVRLPRNVFVEAGGLMAHVHLEEDPGDPEEDALHLRHRALFAAVGVVF